MMALPFRPSAIREEDSRFIHFDGEVARAKVD